MPIKLSVSSQCFKALWAWGVHFINNAWQSCYESNSTKKPLQYALWSENVNYLPASLKNSVSIDVFKKRCKEHFMSIVSSENLPSMDGQLEY